MAIIRVNSADLGNNSSGTGFTTAGYSASGNFLIAAISGDVLNGNDDITSVAYGGNTMTLAVSRTSPSAALTDVRMMYMYYLLNPPAGSHTFVVSAGSAHYIAVGAVEYSGVATSSTIDNTGTDFSGGTTTSFGTSLTTVADNCFVVMMDTGYNANNPPSAGAGTSRIVFDATFGAWGLYENSSPPKTPAGAVSMAITRTSSSNIALTIFSFAPSAAASDTLMAQSCL